jgi:hypothetical protein
VFLPALFALAHLAFAASEIAFLHAALLFTLGFSADVADMDDGEGVFFPHRLATPARMLARPWALSFRFGFRTISVSPFSALSLAHLALAAAAIRARPAALIPLCFGCSVATGVGVSPPPKSEFSSSCSDWIRSWMSAACLNWVGVSVAIAFMLLATWMQAEKKSIYSAMLMNACPCFRLA